MEYKKLLDLVINICKEMLICGAEISRVEDTATRIFNSYNISEVNVFTITSCIIITIKNNQSIYTQTKRIINYNTNLDRLDKLNNLSRYICRNKPNIHYIEVNYNNIIKSPIYSSNILAFIYSLIAFSLTIFFGGNFIDGISSGVLGLMMYLLITKFNYIDANIALLTMIIAFLIGLFAVLFVKIGFGKDLDNIVIGNIMLMIPGVAITNSLRDMISGDTMSGLLRFVESIIKAIAVTLGFVFATAYLGKFIL